MHNLWTEIKRRCLHPGASNYSIYGGRGLTMHPPWAHDYRRFAAYVRRHLGEPKKGEQMDRIDNAVGYRPGNIRWASRQEQCNNTRRNHWLEHDGRYMTIAQWARHLGITHSTISARLQRGMPIQMALYPGKHPPGKRQWEKPADDGPALKIV